MTLGRKYMQHSETGKAWTAEDQDREDNQHCCGVFYFIYFKLEWKVFYGEL